MYKKFGKRLADIVLASVLLGVLAVPMLIIAVIIRATSSGGALFRQDRTGMNGKIFSMYKFRSMVQDNNVHDRASENRITSVGKFLRASSLDELPQLINVVRGDMSFIGPRPWITKYHEHMTASQRRRYSVRPGITGIAQVYGRNNLTIHQKISYDLRYVNNISLREDLKVIVLTFVAILTKEGEAIGKKGIHEELDILKKQFEKHHDGQETANYPENTSREPAI